MSRVNYRQIYKDHYPDVDISNMHIHHLDGDRTNNDISNLIAVTQEDHYKIHFWQRDFGAAALLSDGINAEAPTKPIRQYDLDGYFIREWYSINEAEDWLVQNGTKSRTITQCCKYNKKSLGGYQWFYKDEVGDLDYIGPVERIVENGGHKTNKIKLIDSLTNNEVKSKCAAARILWPNHKGKFGSSHFNRKEFKNRFKYEQE